MTKALSRVFSRRMNYAIAKIRTGPGIQKMQSVAISHHERSLLTKATLSLRSYLEKKNQEMVKNALARKFNYTRRLLWTINIFRRNLERSRAKQQAAWRAAILHRQHTLLRGLRAFLFVGSLAKHKQRKLDSYLGRRAYSQKRSVFQVLLSRREAKGEKRIQAAMAQLKYEKGLLLKHLRLLRDTVATLAAKNKRKSNLEARATRHYRKRTSTKVLSALAQH